MTEKQLLAEIDLLKHQMVAVSTGGPRIDDVNAEYVERWRGVNDALGARGLENPNPHDDLWKWYGKWSSGDLPTYQSRRQYVADMYGPLEKALRERSQGGVARLTPPTGWARVDRGIDKIREQLAAASEPEDFQRVGLLCRETLISVAQAVYDAAKHPPTDDVTPSESDTKRMLDAYVAAELKGGSDEEARAHAKAALKLANALVHRRTATLRDAAMCAEATTSVANLIAIVDGRRFSERPASPPSGAAKEADKALFALFKAALPSSGCISFIRDHDMTSSFRHDALDQLDAYVHSWNSAEYEFFDAELERLRGELREEAQTYLGYVALNTWPIGNVAQAVPAEWIDTQPERFHKTVDRLHKLGAKVVDKHQELVRVARRLLES